MRSTCRRRCRSGKQLRFVFESDLCSARQQGIPALDDGNLSSATANGEYVPPCRQRFSPASPSTSRGSGCLEHPSTRATCHDALDEALASDGCRQRPVLFTAL